MARGEQPVPIRAGDVLAEKYQVERVLGAGGMGYVVSARHLELGARVAIKLLRPEVLDDPDTVARFAREARAMFRLKSEHVGKVLDVGRLPDGSPFMVMEHLEGMDLGEQLKARGRLPVAEALDYVIQACEAVAEAHALGIVHRDIKPQNLFLSRRVDGAARVKVLDFGISKMSGAAEEKMRLTNASTVMGSPFYMSPEQLRSSASVDARSDVWALGVVLYELVTGVLPFTAESPSALYALLLEQTAKPPHLLVPGVPPGLSAVILACLARKADERVQSVEDLAARLEPFGGAALRGSAARVKAVRLAMPSTSGNTAPLPGAELAVLAHGPREGAGTGTSWEGSDSSRKRRARLVSVMIMGGGAAAVILVGVIWMLLTRSFPKENAVAAPRAVIADAPDAAEVIPTPALSVAPLVSVIPTSSGVASSTPPTSTGSTGSTNAARVVKPVVRPASSAKPATSFDAFGSRTWGSPK